MPWGMWIIAAGGLWKKRFIEGQDIRGDYFDMMYSSNALGY